MFNYVKETIVNDASKVVGSVGKLLFKRVADYKVANIVDKKLYKSLPIAGSCAKAILDPSKLPSASLYRYSIFVSTPESEFVEFAYPHFYEFGKPIVVETASNTADGIKAAIELAMPYDNKFLTIVKNTTTNKLEIEAAESWMKFDTFEVGAWNAVSEDFDKISVEGLIDTATYPNKTEYGTAKWIVENLRFPTYWNIRYDKLYSDEAPVPGKNYVEYSFEYKNSRSVPGGTSALGQEVNSITRHVFYVAQDQVTAFEAQLQVANSGSALSFVADTEYGFDATNHLVGTFA